MAVGALAGSVLAGIIASFSGSTKDAGTTLAGEVGLWAGMATAALVVTRRYGTGSLKADLGYRIGPRDIWPGIGAAAAGLVVTEVVSVAFASTRFSGSNTLIITNQKHNGIGFALITVIVGVGAPVFEELFFRGVVRACLASRLGSHGAVWGQAVLFGLAHYQPGNGLGNVSVIVIVGVLGVVLGYTARATRRLGPGMIAHSLFNLVQVVTILSG